MYRKRRLLRGFTLVELLVVIAIISVLASVLLPVLSSVKNQAMLTVCASNQRQLGLGAHMYIADYDGWIPIANDNISRWPTLLYPAYCSDPKLFECPTALNELEGLRVVNRQNPQFFHIAYGVNYQKPWTGYQWHWQKITEISRSSTTLFVCDSFGDTSGLSPLGWWSYCVTVTSSLRTVSDRHKDVVNVLYFDGHVKADPFDYVNTCLDNNRLWYRD